MVASFSWRLLSPRFLGGFVLGAAASSASCVAALQLYDKREPELAPVAPEEKDPLEEYGFPLTGTEARQYINHALAYDPAKRTPKWVIEHLSRTKTVGSADRKHCKFKPDPNIPKMFSATNEDYLGSGWTRGHMAPAGDNKFSTEAMAETFYLSNIVPQNYENNAGFWNRMEMYCRDLTKRFEDVWVVSGPLELPTSHEDGKKRVTYEVIGADEVAVPSHLYKVILVREKGSEQPLAIGAFVVPNSPIGFDHQLPEYKVQLEDLEKMSGLLFFPQLDRDKGLKPLCDVDSCRLIQLHEFKLYIAARRVGGARNLQKLERILSELKEEGITPDGYLLDLYEKKRKEFSLKSGTDRDERKG
ncbi:nuclease EXOG, mitochondrial [Xenopus laevis]|uniref:Nuclease EXOG, mitochondrial n=1 Tax=Xenopus laevis TaxID=8355 RepID=EXOG_XENLA|nr:nuclease EXOG, mitochondrial [Xenopus laevis]Q0IH72.1 RecName: Full=Nuclease EXOG, mitochondrial; AltName: Full=Endonuclease G-like 1; Short=Endo G-like 1; Flags: Precursor [Xenopus laevis]AAI23281.1 Endogl1_predicted protein [Xenopus laevis]